MKRFLSVVFLVLTAAELAAQQPPPPPSAKDTRETSGATTQSNPVTTIRVPVNLVNVMFTVTDKKERMVLNLTKDDFRVLEDNQLQTITNFSRESNLPLRIAILIDTSNSVRDRLHFEEEAAIDFLQETLRPGKDMAFAVGFDVEPQLLQDYTDDVEKLASAVRSLQAGGGTGLYDAIYFACKTKMLIFPPPEPYLRRLMIVVSDGLDNQSEHTREEALAMAQHAEVVIYAISTNRSGISTRGDKVLKRFAEETGGRAFFPFEARDLAANFHEISRELRSQYSLAYVSTNRAHDGTFRTITLQTVEKGLRIQAKNGYFASSQ
ncbi:MAG: VWA domain-containing protein [Acidobacteria bacterium]|nr:MAG: VWA domain-containing protein [Acidobacteriota bacterium]